MRKLVDALVSKKTTVQAAEFIIFLKQTASTRKILLPKDNGCDTMFLLYRVYYGEECVYVGRTQQLLQRRLHGHFFGTPKYRKIEIAKFSKVEFTECESEANMFLYEIYFINKLKPALNRDDRAHDELTVDLPPVEWKEFTSPLFEKWREQIKQTDSRYDILREERDALRQEIRDLKRSRSEWRGKQEEFTDLIFSKRERIASITKIIGV